MVETAARLEGEMTYLKQQAAPEKEASRTVHIYPDIVQTREDMFLFAMIIGQTLSELQNGLRSVSDEAEELFKARFQNN